MAQPRERRDSDRQFFTQLLECDAFGGSRSGHRTACTKPYPDLTRIQQRIIADVLTWDTQREINPDEIEAIALQHDVLWVRLAGNRAIPIALETFRTIRRQQLEEQAWRAAEVDVDHVLKGAVAYDDRPLICHKQKVLTVYTTCSIWTGVLPTDVVVFRLPPNEAASVIEGWERDGWTITSISVDGGEAALSESEALLNADDNQ